MPAAEHDRPPPPQAIRPTDAQAQAPETAAGVSILLADGHALFRAGMRHLLRDLPRPLVTLEADTCAEAVAVLRSNSISLVLLEILLPDSHPDRLVGQLRASTATPVPIIVISAVDDPERICRALEQGAAGFIPKTSAPEVMLQAVALVLAGGVYVPPNVLKLLQYSPGAAAQRKEGPAPDAPALTERQRAVLECLAKGWSNKQIAHALGLSEGTIKIHLAGLLKALNARNRTQAIVYASERGLLP
jgi:DNA-binding NarL/FixJ family response regulator